MSRRVSSVPVVDDSGQLVDIYTKFDVIVSLRASTAVSGKFSYYKTLELGAVSRLRKISQLPMNLQN